ncbi:hypothetical protein M3610_12285 [Neobacillus sp. MER 74]|uniref:hypothetical protein n=1 Tax=Neobacillus sp. MER 74 TaxID=2939566 RepID=UPI00203BC87B|nr:hypothetical protein [Neobacillus sp. MER 74]MCM3116074.1 hypothetical protein [Neobacillus sp. MER 74]
MIKLSDPRIIQFDKAVKLREESTNAFIDYWRDHALYTSLEYWIMVALLVVPLIFLVFKIDKSKLFLIGFYGYSIHVLAAYIDLFAINSGKWNYPFPLIPFLPSISIDSSIVPVTFMLVYQWTLNHKKNFYVYSTITAVFFSLVFKPLLAGLGLFRMYGNMNYFYLLIIYVLGFIAAKMITNVFLWLQKKFTK